MQQKLQYSAVFRQHVTTVVEITYNWNVRLIIAHESAGKTYITNEFLANKGYILINITWRHHVSFINHMYRTS